MFKAAQYSYLLLLVLILVTREATSCPGIMSFVATLAIFICSYPVLYI